MKVTINSMKYQLAKESEVIGLIVFHKDTFELIFRVDTPYYDELTNRFMDTEISNTSKETNCPTN